MNGELGILGSDFQVRETFVSPGGAAKQLCLQDPSRWALLISQANTATAVWVSTLSTVTTNDGVPLAIQDPKLLMNFRDYGGLVQAAWFGFGAVGAIIDVIEVFYRPVDQPIVTPSDMQDLAERLERRESLLATTQARQR